jgi:hypothetical protein
MLHIQQCVFNRTKPNKEFDIFYLEAPSKSSSIYIHIHHTLSFLYSFFFQREEEKGEKENTNKQTKKQLDKYIFPYKEGSVYFFPMFLGMGKAPPIYIYKKK